MEALCQLLRLAQLAEAPTQRPRRRQQRRRRRPRQPAPQLPLALPAPGMPLPQRRRRQRRPRQRQPGPSRGLAQGEVTLRRSEYLESATKATTSFFLSPANFPWLRNLAKAFERVKWLLCDVEWRPTVGTTVSGATALGFDWGAVSTTVKFHEDGHFGPSPRLGAADKNAVLACSPAVEGPAWSPKRLRVARNLLQSRMWYDLPVDTATGQKFDFGPGSVLVFSDASNGGGDIWVHYEVVMQGTRKV